MHPEAFYMLIDWRRAQFSTNHPTVAPAYDCPVVVHTGHTHFLASTSLRDVRVIRDWLYRGAIDYRLLGCYEQVTSVFRGIVIVFENLCDLVIFRRCWIPMVT
jgi:hypothetical protein